LFLAGSGQIEDRSTRNHSMQLRVSEGLTLTLFVVVVFAASAGAAHALRAHTADAGACTDRPLSGGWLLSQPNDAQRFRMVQRQLGGFDRTMWEVGERFRRTHEALQRRNFELAEYHWEKIGSTISSGIVRRPKRAANAQAMFLGENFKSIAADLEKHDYPAAAAAFDRAKSVCIACHQAENVGWVNDQPLFELVLPAQTTTPGNEKK
jgi:hypothetical protein